MIEGGGAPPVRASRVQQTRRFALFDRDRAAERVAVLGARDVVAEHAFVRQQMCVERDLT